jgi:hypothetical protein
MPARDKRKWLTVHALRSGLAEQWATDREGVTFTVELRWIKVNDVFQVMTLRGRQIDKRTQHPRLEDARAAFIKEQKYQQTRSVR